MVESMVALQVGHTRSACAARMNISWQPVSQNTRWPQGTHAYTGGADKQMTHVAVTGALVGRAVVIDGCTAWHVGSKGPSTTTRQTQPTSPTTATVTAKQGAGIGQKKTGQATKCEAMTKHGTATNAASEFNSVWTPRTACGDCCCGL